MAEINRPASILTELWYSMVAQYGIPVDAEGWHFKDGLR